MKQFAISLLGYIPLRSEASERSEMTSQILFGELMRVLELNDKWTFVELRYDAYRGYVDTKMLTFIEDKDYVRLNNLPKVFAQKKWQYIQTDKEDKIPVFLGSSFYNENNNSFYINGTKYTFDAQKEKNTLIDTARSLLHIPYLWGGKTAFGLDCSGFTQLVFRTHGISITRDASQQAEQGEEVFFLNQAKAGDLAFFGDAENINHVGIIIDTQHIIHASGEVKIDRIDSSGIYSMAQKKHTHQLRFIKRIID